MVSVGQMTGLALAILLPIVVALIPYYLIYKHSSKIESGMMGAIAYGFLGFLWQQLMYLMMVVVMTNFDWLRNTIGSNYVASALVYGVLCAVFVALGMYWGVYLTNQKQRSLYRSVTIGIGFGLGSAGWNIFLPYGLSLYHAILINSGSFQGSAELKNSIVNTSVSVLYADAGKSMLMILVFMGTAMILGKFYLEGNRMAAWGTPIVVQLLISFTNALLKQYASATVAKIGLYVLLIALAAISVYMFMNWIKTKEVKLPFVKQR